MGKRNVPREAVHEYHQPTYAVSFRSALICVALFVAIIVGVFVIFT